MRGRCCSRLKTPLRSLPGTSQAVGVGGFFHGLVGVRPSLDAIGTGVPAPHTPGCKVNGHAEPAQAAHDSTSGTRRTLVSPVLIQRRTASSQAVVRAIPFAMP